MRYAYAAAGAGIDIFKCVQPIFIAAACSKIQRRSGWVVFAVLTCLSLLAAYGNKANQMAERIGAKAVEVSKRQDGETALKRLQDERRAIPAFNIATDETVGAAREAVNAAERAIAQECGKVGDNCRRRQTEANERRAELAAAIRDKSATETAAEIDKRIREVETKLSTVDVAKASAEADPQTENISKATGVPVEKVALFVHAIFALGIEAVSGFGLYLLFAEAHGVPPLRAQKTENEMALQVFEQLFPAVETPELIISRFKGRCVMKSTGDTVPASRMYSAYEKWCAEQSIKPVSIQVFGRKLGLEKEKSGTTRYVNVRLTPGYDVDTIVRVAEEGADVIPLKGRKPG
ncbi:MAG: hypothetical protein JSS20_22095 [Proteobacteria bacterium]|nr:hypothetical protein [Pseudomonadota bacterium]